MVGQGHVLRALVNALDSDRLHHAYLFTGTRGVGKTSLARVFAKALNCEVGVSSTPCGTCSSCIEVDEGRCVDLIEVDAASRTKVDETRELLDNVQYAPTRGRYKVYLIDEVHMFSTHSFNALLKTLEEPPPHVKFLLATTDPKKLPVTILSRCLQFNLKRIAPDQILSHLRMIVTAENVTADDASLALIASAADGSVRDSLSLLDQAIAYGNGALNQPDVAAMLGTIAAADVAAMLEFLSADDGPGLIKLARELAQSAPDYHHVLGELLSLIRRVAVLQSLGEEGGALEESDEVVALAEQITPEECQLFYQIGLIGRRDLSLAPDPQSGFEMVLLRMLAFRPVDRDAPPTRKLKSRSAGPAAAVKASAGQSAAPLENSDISRADRQLTRPAAPEIAARAVKPTVEPSHPIEAESLSQPDADSALPELSASDLDTIKSEPLAGSLTRETSSANDSNVNKPVLSANGELDWSETVAQLTLQGLVRELARNTALKAYDGKVIDLVLAPQHENLRAERLVSGLELALREQLHSEVRIRLSFDGDQSLDTPSQRLTEAQRQRQQEAELSIDTDPTIKSLRDVFGATVEKIEPHGNTHE